LCDRYRLHRKIGEGASGTVYQATDLMLQRQVAVKCMKGCVEHAQRGDQIMREAQLLASLRHPNIVDIYDVGCASGDPYFVMELLPQTLADELEQRGALSTDDCVSLLLPLCGALTCAHQTGVLHCDLKPENIGVQRLHASAPLMPKLFDFGIARRLTAAHDGRTVFGTPGYLSPEQVRGERPSAASDVWSLGAIAYRCLAGKHPLSPCPPSAMLARTACERPPSLLKAAPHVHPALAIVVDRALEQSLELRYASMSDLAEALVAAATHAGIPWSARFELLGLPGITGWHAQATEAPTTTRVTGAAHGLQSSPLRSRFDLSRGGVFVACLFSALVLASTRGHHDVAPVSSRHETAAGASRFERTAFTGPAVRVEPVTGDRETSVHSALAAAVEEAQQSARDARGGSAHLTAPSSRPPPRRARGDRASVPKPARATPMPQAEHKVPESSLSRYELQQDWDW
jgi:serine/threonine-protein kinase